MPSYSFAYKALTLVGIRDANEIASERVVLRVVKPANLIEYLILNAGSRKPDAIRDLNQHVYWFPKFDVKEGDFVRLYTRSGRDLTRDGKYGDDKARYHDFFWGKDEPVWRGTSNAVVLVELAEWKFSRLDD